LRIILAGHARHRTRRQGEGGLHSADSSYFSCDGFCLKRDAIVSGGSRGL